MSQTESSMNADILSKVPTVTFAFWLLKVCATTLGETGGDVIIVAILLIYRKSWQSSRSAR